MEVGEKQVGKERITNLEIRRMKISELKAADYNPRVELQPGDPEFDALKYSVEKDGLVLPIIWNEETGNVVGGHQRLAVLRETGEEYADVSVVHMDEKTEKQANIALNRVEGKWDDEKLRDLFAELDTDDIFSTGFSEAELRAIYPEALDDDPIFDEEEDEEDSSEEEETVENEFTVYLSFPSKKAAEKWATDAGYEPEFSSGRTMIIRMDEDAEEEEEADED